MVYYESMIGSLTEGIAWADLAAYDGVKTLGRLWVQMATAWPSLAFRPMWH